MKYKTETNKGQSEYALPAELLGIKCVRLNGRIVYPEFKLVLTHVPRKYGYMTLDIERLVVKESNV